MFTYGRVRTHTHSRSRTHKRTPHFAGTARARGSARPVQPPSPPMRPSSRLPSESKQKALPKRVSLLPWQQQRMVGKLPTMSPTRQWRHRLRRLLCSTHSHYHLSSAVSRLRLLCSTSLLCMEASQIGFAPLISDFTCNALNCGFGGGGGYYAYQHYHAERVSVWRAGIDLEIIPLSSLQTRHMHSRFTKNQSRISSVKSVSSKEMGFHCLQCYSYHWFVLACWL